MTDTDTIVNAYHNKYEDADSEREDPEIKLVFVKRQDFQLLNLVLDNCNISRTGPLEKLKDICSRVTDCVLSHNQISDWNQIFDLLNIGEKITFLNISNNKLGVCDNIPTKRYESLKCLAVTGNSIQWENFQEILPFLPSLTHLNIGYSNISEFPCKSDLIFPNLNELNLIQNNIMTFQDVSELSNMFPNLHTLVLSDNPLNSFGESSEIVGRFSKLAKLHVNNIAVRCWEEVSKLRWFPALRDVRMVHWDLFGEMKEAERRKMLGALLPNIHLINGAPLPEREGCERWYMRRCTAARDTDDRRYRELHDKYGELPELGEVTLGGRDETITLILCVPERGLEMEKSFSIYETPKSIKMWIQHELKFNKGRLMLRKIGGMKNWGNEVFLDSSMYYRSYLHRCYLEDSDRILAYTNSLSDEQLQSILQSYE